MGNKAKLDKYIDRIESLPIWRENGVNRGEVWNQADYMRVELAGEYKDMAAMAPIIKLENGQLSVVEESFKPFHCGTSYCLAGEVAVDTAPSGTVFYNRGADMVLPDGTRLLVREWAARELELTEEQALTMFSSGNTLHRLRKLAEEYGD